MKHTLIDAQRVATPDAAMLSRWRESMDSVLVGYGAVGAVTLLLCLLEDPLQWLGLLLASLLPLVGLLVGVRRFQPASVAPWLLLWAGQVAFFLGDVVFFGAEMGTLGSRWDAGIDGAYLVGYSLTAIGLGLFINRRLPEQRLAPFVDAVTVGVAGAMIFWLVQVEPLIHASALGLGETMTILGYPIGDVLLLGAVAYLLLAARTTGAASHLLVASLAALLLADVLSASHVSGPQGESWSVILRALSYVLIGAAALVPSMRELTEPAPAATRTRSRRQQVALVAALLVLPATASIQLLLVGHLHAEVVLVATFVLGAMVLLGSQDAARQLAKRERRWETLLAKASDAFAIVAADGTLSYVSPASERIMGAPPQDRIGQSPLGFFSLVHPDDRDGPGARLAGALQADAAEAQERLRVLLPDGSLRWLEVLVRDLRHDEDLRGVVINYRDVTDEVEASLELEHRGHLLTAAEGLAHLGSARWQLDSGQHIWSDGMWALLGLEPGSAPVDETTFFARVHPDDVAGLEPAYARLLEQRRTIAMDFRIVRPDGSHIEVHGIGEVETTADGRPERIVTTFRDVTSERQAERSLRSQAEILANVREAIVVTDLDGRITHWGNGAATLFGFRPGEMLGQPLGAVYGDAAARLLEDLARMDAGPVQSGEMAGRRKDGSEVPLDVRSTVLWSADGEPAGNIHLAIDATEQRAARASLDRLWAAIEQTSESVVITDAEARIEYVNPAFERITGYSREEVTGKNPRILKSGAQPDAFYRSMWGALAAGQTWTADLENRRKDGTIFEEQATISPISDGSGRVTGYVAVKRDVTEERRLEGEAMRAARERSLIMETIGGFDDHELPEATAEAIGRQVCRLSGAVTAGLFILAPDGRASPYGFTVRGVAVTDTAPVPRRRSRYLLGRARRGPWIADWKDRPSHPYNTVFKEAGVVAIAYAPVRHGGEVIGFLHLSCGGAEAHAVLASHLAALVQIADLCGAVLGGRLSELSAAKATRTGISRVISSSAFVPVFQPIVELEGSEIVGYEGLTRFRDDVRPDLRFAEAERAGMGQQLELATLEVALAAARDLPHTAWLDLNVSPGLVLESAALARLLQRADRPIVLEVTEHEEIDDYERFRSAVARLGEDVRIAVDDAGSGYASLRHILELRPGLVKLDRSLIMGIESDEARRALVAGMRRFAGDADIQLIAEGVETQGELDTLRDLGIELAQGFLLGRPQPVEQALPTQELTDRAQAVAVVTSGPPR